MSNVMIIPQAFRVNPQNIGLPHVLIFCRPHPAPVRKLKNKQTNNEQTNLPLVCQFGRFLGFQTSSTK